MKKITEHDIELINKLYLQYGTYTGVAEAMGISAGTVKRYIYPGYLPDSNSVTSTVLLDSDLDLDEIEDFADIKEEEKEYE